MPIQIDSLNTSPEVVLGIDLGTTHSLVAVVRNGKPEVLVSREGKRLLPSVVSVVSGQPVIGFEAKRKKVRDAQHTAFSVKRLLGKGFDDLKSISGSLPYKIEESEGLPRIRLGDLSFTAIEISALILRELKASAEASLGVKANRAVITVPAYFNDSQRQATRTAGRLAGLDVLRIVNEPTAASLAYGLDRKRQGLIAVFDLGGGTFDISILKLHDGIFEVLATQGDTSLGGDDLDFALVEVAAQEILKQWGIDIFLDVQLHAALLEEAEATKIALSKNSEAIFQVSVHQQIYKKRWTLQEFEKLVSPVLERTREPCMSALRDAGLTATDLSDVVMVGGPTRLKIVQAMAQSIFGREPNTSVHPDEVVAEGAAIQADILAGNNKDLLLLDVVPLSLGLETYGGLMSSLIPRNTRIPTVVREVFTTFADHQTGVDIHVLQGERDKVVDNRSLARFKLKGIQPGPAGVPRIELTFLIDADGILQVAAKDLKTESEQSIEVRPSFGLTEEQIEKMLISGMAFADSDVRYRKRVEVRNQAEPVLRAAERKLSDAFRLLSHSDAQAIQEAIEHLKRMLEGDDAQKIADANNRLNQATLRLAEILIQETLSSVGKNSP